MRYRCASQSSPMCFVTPVDRVKPKGTTQLARLKNLDRYQGATLLCEHWSMDDWSQLWWVRAHLVHRPGHDVDGPLLNACDGELREKYLQYRDTDFAELVLFDVECWSVGPLRTADPQAEAAVTDPLM